MSRLFIAFSAVLFGAMALIGSVQAEETFHTSPSLIGPTKYPVGFAHYDYVNPNAPKGGTFNSAARGTFDSFNPFIVKGEAAAGLTTSGGLLWDTLMAQSTDEPSVSHPLIAEGYSNPADFSSATYRINPKARWHDGKPITAADVKFSMELLKEHSPTHVRYFANVKAVEIIDTHNVKFIFDQKNNRELPHIMGDLVVLPKHWWEGKDAQGKPRDFTARRLKCPWVAGPIISQHLNPARPSNGSGYQIIGRRIRPHARGAIISTNASIAISMMAMRFGKPSPKVGWKIFDRKTARKNGPKNIYSRRLNPVL